MTNAIGTRAAETKEESVTAIEVTLGPPIPGTIEGSSQHVGATVLKPGTEVHDNQMWCTSPSRAFVLIMQRDGNLVQYRVERPPHGGWKQGATFKGDAVWSSGTINPKKGKRFVVQTDGNLVIYNEAGKDVWSSNTAGNMAGLYVQNDGNIVLYALTVKWSTI